MLPATARSKGDNKFCGWFGGDVGGARPAINCICKCCKRFICRFSRCWIAAFSMSDAWKLGGCDDIILVMFSNYLRTLIDAMIHCKFSFAFLLALLSFPFSSAAYDSWMSSTEFITLAYTKNLAKRERKMGEKLLNCSKEIGLLAMYVLFFWLRIEKKK